MARKAREYRIYLPTTKNDQTPIPDEVFTSVEQRLIDRFGGLTTQRRELPLRGIWQSHQRLYYDTIIMISVLDFRPRGSAHYVRELKRDLLRELQQLEILITEMVLRVH